MVALLEHVGTADWDKVLIEYVRKHTGQLVCACSEGAAGDAVWAWSLARVDTFKCFTHLGCSEGEATCLGCRPCQWHCIVLKAGKKVIWSAWEQDILVCDGAGFFFVIRD